MTDDPSKEPGATRPLPDEKCPEATIVATDFSKLALLTRVPNELQAALLRDALADHGIDVQVIGALTSGFRAEAPGDLRLLVRQNDLEQAQAALANLANQRPEVDWSNVDFGDLEATGEPQRTFDVFRSPSGTYQAIKCGFSWPAFFLGAVWAFVKGLWLYGLAILLAQAFLLWCLENMMGVDNLVFALLIVVVFVFAGIKGNAWRRQSMQNKGCQHVGTVAAHTPEAAILAVAGV